MMSNFGMRLTIVTHVASANTHSTNILVFEVKLYFILE